jgi:hypothetical protein
MQIHDDRSGVTTAVFQTADSKTLCEALNANYWRGVQTSCPNCKREINACDSDLPSAYVGLFKDRPFVFPYVSAPHIRIVFFGVPLPVAQNYCEKMAAQMTAGMNQLAKCILP